MKGEDVVVEVRRETGRDPGNAPIFEWAASVVSNVLVSPGARTDVPESTRPDGTEVAWTLHFPRPYAEPLRGARISVKGQPPARVIGDPQPFSAENTPTDWWMPVEVEAVRG